MTNHPPRRPSSAGWSIVLAWIVPIAFAPLAARAQSADSARQVTIFGIVATPNKSAIDPKLKEIAPQLRKLLPNHGFTLLDVQSKRLVAGKSVSCKLRGNFTASTTLTQVLDTNGKVQLLCELQENGMTQVATQVATPPNQLFFCDKMLPNGTRLLIGIGAR